MAIIYDKGSYASSESYQAGGSNSQTTATQAIVSPSDKSAVVDRGGTSNPTSSSSSNYQALSPREKNILDIARQTGYTGQSGEMARQIESRIQGYSYDAGGSKLYLNNAGTPAYISGVSGITTGKSGELVGVNVRSGGMEYGYGSTYTPEGWIFSQKDVQNKSYYSDLNNVISKKTGKPIVEESQREKALQSLGFKTLANKVEGLADYASRVDAEDISNAKNVANTIAGFTRQYGLEAQYFQTKQSGRGFEIYPTKGTNIPTGISNTLEQQIIASGLPYSKIGNNRYYIMPKDRTETDYIAGKTIATNPITSFSFDFGKNDIIVNRKSGESQPFSSLSAGEKVSVKQYYGSDINALTSNIYQAMGTYQKISQADTGFMTKNVSTPQMSYNFGTQYPLVYKEGKYQVENLDKFIQKELPTKTTPSTGTMYADFFTGYLPKGASPALAIKIAGENISYAKQQESITRKLEPRIPYLPEARGIIDVGGKWAYNINPTILSNVPILKEAVPFLKEKFYTPNNQDVMLGWRYAYSPSKLNVTMPSDNRIIQPVKTNDLSIPSALAKVDIGYLYPGINTYKAIGALNDFVSKTDIPKIYSGEAGEKIRSSIPNIETGKRTSLTDNMIPLKRELNLLSDLNSGIGSAYEQAYRGVTALENYKYEGPNKLYSGYINPYGALPLAGLIAEYPKEWAETSVGITGMAGKIGLTASAFPASFVTLGSAGAGFLSGQSPKEVAGKALKPLAYEMSGIVDFPRYATDVSTAIATGPATYGIGFVSGLGVSSLFGNRKPSQLLKAGEESGLAIGIYSAINPLAYKALGTTAEAASVKAGTFSPKIAKESIPIVMKGLKPMYFAGATSMGGASAITSLYSDLLSGNQPSPIKAGISGIIGAGAGLISEPIIQMGIRPVAERIASTAKISEPKYDFDKTFQVVDSSKYFATERNLQPYDIYGRAEGTINVDSILGGGKYNVNIASEGTGLAQYNKIFYEGKAIADISKGGKILGSESYGLSGAGTVQKNRLGYWEAEGLYKSGLNEGRFYSTAIQNPPLQATDTLYGLTKKGYTEQTFFDINSPGRMFFKTTKGENSLIEQVGERNIVNMKIKEFTPGSIGYDLGSIKLGILETGDIRSAFNTYDTFEAINSMGLTYSKVPISRQSGGTGKISGKIISISDQPGEAFVLREPPPGKPPTESYYGFTETLLEPSTISSATSSIRRTGGATGGYQAGIDSSKILSEPLPFEQQKIMATPSDKLTYSMLGKNAPLPEASKFMTNQIEETFIEGGIKPLSISGGQSYARVSGQQPFYRQASIEGLGAVSQASSIASTPSSSIIKAITAEAMKGATAVVLPIAVQPVMRMSDQYIKSETKSRGSMEPLVSGQTTLGAFSPSYSLGMKTAVSIANELDNLMISKSLTQPGQSTIRTLETQYTPSTPTLTLAETPSIQNIFSNSFINFVPFVPSPNPPVIPTTGIPLVGFGPGGFLWGYNESDLRPSYKSGRGYRPSLTAAFFGIAEPKNKRKNPERRLYTGLEIRGLV